MQKEVERWNSPRLEQDTTLRVFGFVVLISIVTGVTFSLVPALRATRIDLSSSLKDSSRTVAGSRSLSDLVAG